MLCFVTYCGYFCEIFNRDCCNVSHFNQKICLLLLSSSAFQVYSSVNFEPRCDLHFAMTGCFFHTADVTEIFMMRFKMLSLLVF